MFSCKFQAFRFGCFAFVSVVCLLLCNHPTLGQPVSEPTTTKRYQDFVNKIMKTVDVDNDGVIDESEKKQFDRPLFNNADSNNDGLITVEEILAKVAGRNVGAMDTLVSANTVPQALDIRVSVLKLPRAFSDHQVVSVDDILAKVVSKESEEMGAEAKIRLMDQFELTVLDGTSSSIQLSGKTVGSVFKSNRKGSVVWQQAKQPFETSLRVTPRIHDKFTQLKVELVANYSFHDDLLPNDKNNDLDEIGVTPVELRYSSTMQFDEKNTATANVLSSGQHFLLVVNIQ